MSAPGWYPDPADPARLRRWDGHQWTGDVQPATGPTATPFNGPGQGPPAGPGAPQFGPYPAQPAPGQAPSRPGGGLRSWLVVALALLAALAITVVAINVLGNRTTPAGPGIEDSNSASPSVSGWNEMGTPDPSSAKPMNCEPGRDQLDSIPTGDLLQVGSLSIPSPGADWDGPFPETRMPLGRDGWGYRQVLPEVKPWASSMTIGIVADPNFVDTRSTVRTMAQCILTSGFYASVNVKMDDYVDRAIAIDQVGGIEANFTVWFDDPDLVTKGSRLRIVVMETSPEFTWFYSAVPIERQDHIDLVDTVTSQMHAK